MKNRVILGVGHRSANVKVTNYDLEKLVDTSNEWIAQRTGIEARYISDSDNTSDLGYKAALNAIKDAKIDVNDIDLIIVATISPDHITPSVACLIQEKLGLNDKRVMAFDINAACSGFIYAMEVACALLESHRCALVIGSETLSKLIDWTDRNTCVLFGDGAGAIILGKKTNNKDIYFYSQSIGDKDGKLICQGKSISKNPLRNNTESYSYLKMDGQEVFRFAIKALEDGIKQVLDQASLSVEDIDLFIPHQANIRIIQYVIKKLKIDESKFYINLNEYGNTSAASVAIALSMAKKEGKIHDNMRIILVGFGAGFTYASCLIEL